MIGLRFIRRSCLRTEIIYNRLRTAEQFARLVRKIDGSRKGDGTLLDHCFFTLGSGLSSGKTHISTDLPTVIAGSECGAIATNRHNRYDEGTPIANLCLRSGRLCRVRSHCVLSVPKNSGPRHCRSLRIEDRYEWPSPSSARTSTYAVSPHHEQLSDFLDAAALCRSIHGRETPPTRRSGNQTSADSQRRARVGEPRQIKADKSYFKAITLTYRCPNEPLRIPRQDSHKSAEKPHSSDSVVQLSVRSTAVLK